MKFQTKEWRPSQNPDSAPCVQSGSSSIQSLLHTSDLLLQRSLDAPPPKLVVGRVRLCGLQFPEPADPAPASAGPPSAGGTGSGPPAPAEDTARSSDVSNSPEVTLDGKGPTLAKRTSADQESRSGTADA